MAKRQYGQYDKIFKENIEEVIPTLIAKLLKINSVKSEELAHDVHHTRERKPDVLKRITDIHEKTFILHLEIQLSDEQEMVYRMAEYDVMLLRKYKIPVEQYVIYIGRGKPKMPVALETPRHRFSFPMIILSEIDYAIFLNSNQPGEIVFAILGDFQKENPHQAISKIVKRVPETSPLKRHLVQLRVLSQIRKLEIITEKAMESIDRFFKEEKDFLYIKGKEQGLVQGLSEGLSKGLSEGLSKGLSQKEYEKNLLFTRSLISETNFDDQKIASLVGVLPDFVKKVREQLKDNN